jgi:hypothetical protein
MCGDGVCTPEEVESCPQDCGTPGGSDAGVTGNRLDAGLVVIDAGSSGVDAGSGGALNCNDPTVILDCEECILGTCTGGTTFSACEVCLGI